MTPCPHPVELMRLHPAENRVQCGVCGYVWVSRVDVQRHNFRVTRIINQQLGSLVAGNNAPKNDAPAVAPPQEKSRKS